MNEVLGMAEPRGPSSKIEIHTVAAKQTATVRDTVVRDEMSAALGRAYQAVNEVIGEQGIEPAGAPFARYHEFGETVDMEAGLPVSRAIVESGDVKPSQLPGGPAATAIHSGPYEGLKATYDAIEEWMRRLGRAGNGGPWEIYLTDPSTEPDPNKWLTQVIWPLRVD